LGKTNNWKLQAKKCVTAAKAIKNSQNAKMQNARGGGRGSKEK
jgi:hypothetical protein